MIEQLATQHVDSELHLGRGQMAEPQPDAKPRLHLVGAAEYEYDKSFVGESGFLINIVFQGENVVKNRKALIERMAAVAGNGLITEEV